MGEREDRLRSALHDAVKRLSNIYYTHFVLIHWSPSGPIPAPVFRGDDGVPEGVYCTVCDQKIADVVGLDGEGGEG